MTVRESREHTASYYAATANITTDFPRLQGEHHCDVAVVGGDSEEFDMFSRVKHWYLPGGKWFANPAVALGMLYCRLKELL